VKAEAVLPMKILEPKTESYQPGRTESVRLASCGPLTASAISEAGQAPRIRWTLNELDQIVRRLLYRRLRAVCIVMSLGFFVVFLLMVTGRGDPVLLLSASPMGLALICGSVVGMAASVALLTARPGLSLTSLRKVELVNFGQLAAYSVHFRFLSLTGEIPGGYEGPAHHDLAVKLALAIAIIVEMVVIVYYGVFIPNTWRRCLTVTGIFVSLSLAATLIAGWQNGFLRSQLPFVLSVSCLDWSLAVVLAGYGSFKINTLQKEAHEARKFGQYTLRECLGSGGMGEVYLAQHVLLRRPSAIKVIRPERAGDAKNLLRFEREVQAAATLTHPNAVQIYDYGLAEDGTFYYVMEYLPGLTLEQLVLRHGPLSPSRACRILVQVCGVLNEAHSIGLIHRDLKPGNIMVCERGGIPDVAKLLDFGLVVPQEASRDGKLTLDGIITGTPAYMSPEQASGQVSLDARSDVYSLGALAYFLLTGRPPFEGSSVVAVLAAHMYEPPTPLNAIRSDVPESLQSIVLRCLAKNAAERFPNAQSMERALARELPLPTCEAETKTNRFAD
jgi:serine/threonine-protein kinase